jgi:hypothetical protein
MQDMMTKRVICFDKENGLYMRIAPATYVEAIKTSYTAYRFASST